ncbi:MAG: proline dehydrogenase family protein, partial [Myxococcales bacterium]|nr:proline dehydrogenase family protein [Myxococcales bacterium]
MKVGHEDRVRAIGEQLFERMAGHAPGVFDKAWWSGQVLEWAMRDPAFKTEMFRFVDVFPVLDGPEAIGEHVREYLLKPGLNVPGPIKLALKGANLSKLAMKVAAGQIAKNLEAMGRGFIAGRDPADAVATVQAMRAQGLAFTVDLLGEATVSEVEARAYAERYLALIDTLADAARAWGPDERLDRDDHGAIPAVNVSVKVSAMHSQLDALDLEASVEAAALRLIPVFERARDRGVFINLDLESYGLKDVTLALFKRVMGDPRLADYAHAGVVIQAYLRDAEQDLEDLIRWARKTARRRITVRLVKGAYWDYETVHAAQEGWASPVWLDKSDSDACYERCAATLLNNHKHIRAAFASHNVRSLAFAMATAEACGVPKAGFEIQCLYGMAEPIKAACVAEGYRVRVYTPVGELIPGMAYLVRRLLENTSNEGWLRQGFAEKRSTAELLAAPKRVERDPWLRPRPKAKTSVDDPGPFINEPMRDFNHPEPRAAFAEAVARAPKRLGKTWGPLIDGKVRKTGRTLDSVDPADGATVVGTVHLAGKGDADDALAAAQAAWPDWRDRPWRDRAAVLFDAAARMRARRDELAALMVREVGKTWREADADTCEAIDFCEYYARQAVSLFQPERLGKFVGELNTQWHQPRGVAAVISPWNFPL